MSFSMVIVSPAKYSDSVASLSSDQPKKFSMSQSFSIASLFYEYFVSSTTSQSLYVIVYVIGSTYSGTVISSLNIDNIITCIGDAVLNE